MENRKFENETNIQENHWLHENGFDIRGPKPRWCKTPKMNLPRWLIFAIANRYSNYAILPPIGKWIGATNNVNQWKNTLNMSMTYIYLEKGKWTEDNDINDKNINSGYCKYLGIYEAYIIIIMSCRYHGYPWHSLATSPYHSSPLAGLLGYIPYPHRAVVCIFELVVLLLLSHMWGSIGVHHLWTRPCLSSSVLKMKVNESIDTYSNLPESEKYCAIWTWRKY